MKISPYIQSFIDFMYPRYCAGCERILLRNEADICLKCLYHLPKTNFVPGTDNKTEQIFWGRLNFELGASFLHFEKGNLTQRIIHQFKYKQQKNIGLVLGRIYGAELAQSGMANIDGILAIPLHPKKLSKRGYNQSAVLADGMAEGMNKPIFTDILFRMDSSDTQTKKGRYARWQNVASIFHIKHPELLENKHVLLVDDIVTTGATLEAAAQCILKACDCKISLATLAVTGVN